MCSSVFRSIGNVFSGAVSAVSNFIGLGRTQQSSAAPSGGTTDLAPQVKNLPPPPQQREDVRVDKDGSAEDTTAMREARERKQRVAALNTGRSSTLLTGAQGLRQAASTARKTLLGE